MVMAILPFSQATYQPVNRLAPATVEQGVTVAEGEDTLWFKDKVEGLLHYRQANAGFER